MKKAEIKRKFDEIIAFAETEKFIDTPVKRYSSGMYVRLAFAVAAHLEPEILIVDEVLAVGDARFQKKCLNKMQDVGHQGRTVLFVSHNMLAITRLCERVILLDEGMVLRDGPSHHVVSAYLNSGLSTMAAREWPDPAKAPGGEVARLRAVRIRSEDGRVIEAVDIKRPARIEMEYEVLKPGCLLLPNFQLFNGEGLHIFSTHDTDPALRRCARQTGRYVSTVWIPGNLLTDGTMFVGVGLETVAPATVQFYEPDAIGFQVIEGLDCDGESARGDYGGRIGGVIRPLLKWTHNFFDEIDSK
jgi:lipopolysaccharide transport system ATP-binding protein